MSTRSRLNWVCWMSQILIAIGLGYVLGFVVTEPTWFLCKHLLQIHDCCLPISLFFFFSHPTTMPLTSQP